MSTEIRVPSLAESIAEATVGTWLKQVGDPVTQGDTVLELETDKVNLEVPAPVDGTLESVTVQEGSTVTEGDVLGMIAEGAGPSADAGQTAPAAPQAAGQANGGEAPAQASQPAAAEPASAGSAPGATPVARRLAAQHGVDLGKLRGSGREGRITREDVEAFLESGDGQAPEAAAAPEPARQQAPAQQPEKPRTAPEPERPETRERLSRRRQTIAERLQQAQQTAVMTTTYNEIDMHAVVEFRRQHRDSFQERHGVRLGFMSFFVKAVVGALKQYPRLNSELQGNELVYKRYYDIGIAVSSDDGLVVPVLRNADRKSFGDIESQILDMAERTRDRKLTLDELQGGTFSITNGGVFGSMMSTPVLNMPQVGILGMHRMIERPVAVNGEVVIRPMMYVALTYDHRVVDGSEAVSFLATVKSLVEDPQRMLLDV